MKRFAFALTALALAGCDNAAEPANNWEPKPYVQLENPEWSRDAVIYQVNTRQFSEEGTFKAVQEELPRLKELGVDILWFMPIHPIGEVNRKSTLGSPYSVKDYYDVNPEFGTKEDFKALVDAAHEQGFKVILDLVANHTAWDHPLASEHPDWYEKTWDGDFRPTPWWDWSDIIDLDWTKPGVREHIGLAMEYWVRDFGVDGYRADVAGYVPVDFWETMRARLNEIRPVFMLGEVQETAFHRASFDATYAWDWHHTSKDVAKGAANPTAFYGYYAENESLWPREAMRMTYIENHDSNSWEGTVRENYAAGLEAATALAFTGEGIPLVYNGMEACNNKRLEFFEKDGIDWSKLGDARTCEYGQLLADLIAFRKANPALENGKWGARMQKVETDQPDRVFAWVREEDGNKVLGLFNFSGETTEVRFADGLAAESYAEFRGSKTTVASGDSITISPWGFRLFSKLTP
ncbi:alpha-amylase [Altererythrobacter luteolus]|uniref:Alpha-amylase n=1 Tax=Pontixanthobacter luteolus TaxID=295089 RepID=A0A6I4V3R2_9SPHN|nr:alpha-amylase family glycosyl hydrolase [Pontixanthobacter luteolus]MXP47430.1 alpha-amylase [Pontixanthobacter luteolus]